MRVSTFWNEEENTHSRERIGHQMQVTKGSGFSLLHSLYMNPKTLIPTRQTKLARREIGDKTKGGDVCPSMQSSNRPSFHASPTKFFEETTKQLCQT